MNIFTRFMRWKTNADYWEQSAITTTLQHAWGHMFLQYWSSASSKERGKLLPEQQEALDMLHRLGSESLERQCEL